MKAKERAERVQELFHDALEQPESERAAYLTAECGDDVVLFEEIASLLAADPAKAAMLEHLVDDHLDEAMKTIREGEIIGQYRLVRELDRGGHGIVYLAEQVGGEVERQVAIKLLKRGIDTDEVVRRFRGERQILAGLKHSFIPHLYDADTTSDGRPYFVMEYVEGKPIREYCQSHRFSIADRLRLFRKVCAAVQFAHQHFIVHRDLKPSNVLVTESGEPKLLDFGIAKILNPDSSPSLTTANTRVLTPAYSSPEQLHRQPITAATDVYSLGVMLYELLAGARPYDLTDCSDQETQRLVCEQVPIPPSLFVERSTATEDEQTPWEGHSRKWRQEIHGDLDTIVLMALNKEPERRYATVGQLSEDIDRFLKGLPVQARRATLSYQLRKFVGRNRRSLAVALMFLVIVVAFLINREGLRNEIEFERDQAQDLSQFLLGLFRESDTFFAGTSGPEISALNVLRRGTEKVRQGELDDDPQARAAIFAAMGSSFKSLGEYEEATDLLEEALEIREKHFGAQHRDTLDTKETLAQLYHELGQYERAEPLYHAVLEARRLEYGEHHPLVGKALSNIGLGLHEQGRFKEALQRYQKTVDIYEKTLDPFDLEVAYNLNNLACTYNQLGELQNAEAALLRVDAIFATKLPPNDSRVAINLASLGNLYTRQENFGKAITSTRKALEIQLNVLPPDHPNTGLSYLNLGSNHRRLQRYAEAEELIQESLRIFQVAYPEGHKDTAYALESLARTRDAQGRKEEAETLYRDSLTLFRTMIPNHPKTTESANELAGFLEEQGKLAEAQALREEISRLNADQP